MKTYLILHKMIIGDEGGHGLRIFLGKNIGKRMRGLAVEDFPPIPTPTTTAGRKTSSGRFVGEFWVVLLVLEKLGR
jgi:hypothetical protein